MNSTTTKCYGYYEPKKRGNIILGIYRSEIKTQENGNIIIIQLHILIIEISRVHSTVHIAYVCEKTKNMKKFTYASSWYPVELRMHCWVSLMLNLNKLT